MDGRHGLLRCENGTWQSSVLKQEVDSYEEFCAGQMGRLNHLKMGKPAVAIGYLERFAADYERESANISIPEVAEKNGIKIAVVGSGPAGLSFAGDMAKRGYDVTVFEALHEIGGVLKYGIPEFRLPNKIVDVEIEGLRKMGASGKTEHGRR